MMNGPTHPKMRGVGQTPTPATSNGTPRTVLQVVRLEQYAVYYNDENGVPRVNILIQVGDQMMFPPNGIDWAASLRPAAEWMKKGVLGQIGTGGEPEALPTQDTVDVMSTGTKE